MPVVPPLKTESYLRYEEMCQHVRTLADALPHLVKVHTIGASRSGRSLLLVEVTAQATGAAESKPAVWLDGNNRGCEVGSSMACLAVLQGLATEYGRDERITNLLDRCVFYIMPRVCLDGAEASLATGCDSEGAVRSGIKPCDIDGNGRVLQMRRRHPLGEWKASAADGRLMVPRTWEDTEGPFYQLVCEGIPASVTEDATGESLPEEQARRSFIETRQNICAALSLNGNADGIAYSQAPDMEPKDAQLFERIGQFLATSAEVPLTKDRCLSWTEDMYRERGLLVFRAGLWSFQRLAELDAAHPFAESEQVRALQWLDSLGIENSFVPWQTFEHPDWGEVEIGGWDLMQVWHNPPLGELLDGFCQTHLELVLSLAELLPDLRWNNPLVEIVGRKIEANGGRGKAVAWNRVEAELSNWGYLPTWLTERYRAQHQGVSVSLLLPEGGKTVSQPQEISCGHLAGMVSAHLGDKGNSMLLGGSREGRSCRVSWLIEGGSKVELTAVAPAGGRAVVAAAVSAPSTSFAASSEEMAPAPSEAPRVPSVSGRSGRPSRGESSANSSANQARNVSLLQGLGLDSVSASSGVAKPGSGGVIRSASASDGGAAEKNAQVSTVDLTGGRSVVRPVNLLGKASSEVSEMAAAPEPNVPVSDGHGAMGGYRPQARPTRPAGEAGGFSKPFPSGEYRAVGSPSGEYRAVAEREATSARLTGRSDSPLRKEVPSAPSGRVFGQSSPKPGGNQPVARAPLGRPVGHAEAEQRRQQMERAQSLGEVTTYGGFEVKPHSLLGNKKPVSEPEPEPPVTNPVPSGPVTAQLLRRNKEE